MPKAVRPNNRTQPAPLRGPKIDAILKVRFVSMAVPIYTAAANAPRR
jgi:hypothetical protein